MELRLDSVDDETLPQSEEFEQTEEEQVEQEFPVFKYFTREGQILPINERTRKKQQIREAEEKMRKLKVENEKKAEYEQRMRLLELNNEKKKRKEEEELQKKSAERRLAEETEELERMVSLSEWKLCAFVAKHLPFSDKDESQSWM